MSAITGYHSFIILLTAQTQSAPLLADTGMEESVSLNGRVEISAVDIFCLLVWVILVALRGQEVIGLESILSQKRITLFLGLWTKTCLERDLDDI